MNAPCSGTIFKDAAGSDRQSAAFPGICVLADGRWISTFRTAPTKKATRGQSLSISWSDDSGATWSSPIQPFAPVEADGKPGRFRGGYCTPLPDGRLAMVLCWVDHSDPELPFYNESTEGLLDTRIFISLSQDSGASWEEPRLIDTAPFSVPTPITGPLLLQNDGGWILQFELNKHYLDPEPWIHSSVVMFSSDEGHSWPDYRIVSRHSSIFYWDQRPGLLTDGSLLDLFWTYDNTQTRYLNIHSRRSEDGGKTWGEFIDTGIPGQPAQPVDIGDGKLVMVYVDRTDAPTIRTAVSRDRGRTWTVARELYRHPVPLSQQYRKGSMNDAWEEMGKFSVGLPCTCLTPSGDLLVSFYAGETTDHTGIEWIRVPRTDLIQPAGLRGKPEEG